MKKTEVITIKDFLINEIKTYQSYKKLNQYERGILNAYEIALLVINQNEVKDEKNRSYND